MKIETGVGAGSVTEDGHKGWIALTKVNQSIEHEEPADPFSQGKLVGGALRYKDFVVAKDTDKTSPDLLKQASTGTTIGTVQIHLCDDVHTVTPVVKFELSNCIVTKFSIDASGGSRPVEELTIRFAKIKMEFVPIDQKGTPGAATQATFDLLTKKAS